MSILLHLTRLSSKMIVKLSVSTLGAGGTIIRPGTEIKVNDEIGAGLVKSGKAVEVVAENKQVKKNVKKSKTKEGDNAE